MEVIAQEAVAVRDATHAGSLRRLAATLAERVDFDATAAGNLAIIVTEAATNLVKHARDGDVQMWALRDGAMRGVRVLTLDSGPGIADVAGSLRDGFSTAGSLGTGLGAVARLATVFDVHSGPRGTVLFAEIWNDRVSATRHHAIDVGAVCMPKPGENVCGDGWGFMAQDGERSLAMVVDGLGHGPDAAAAAYAAMRIFREHAAGSPIAALLERIHDGLRATRGAAAAIAELDRAQRLVRFAGVGNVAGVIVNEPASRNCVSHHGVLGHDVRRIQEFTYPWPVGAPVVLHSDGIATRWRLDAYPGLVARHPMLVAGVLYRDSRRERDDATVVVLREAS